MTENERIALAAIRDIRGRDANGFAKPPRGLPLLVITQLRSGGLVETRERLDGAVEVKLTIAGLKALADARGALR